MKQPGNWFMHLDDKIIPDSFIFRDKVNISYKRYCPPHYIPHTIPIICPLVTKEPCHFHKNTPRMIHHVLYCNYLKCQNYKPMIGEYAKHFKKNLKKPIRRINVFENLLSWLILKTIK